MNRDRVAVAIEQGSVVARGSDHRAVAVGTAHTEHTRRSGHERSGRQLRGQPAQRVRRHLLSTVVAIVIGPRRGARARIVRRRLLGRNAPDCPRGVRSCVGVSGAASRRRGASSEPVPRTGGMPCSSIKGSKRGCGERARGAVPAPLPSPTVDSPDGTRLGIPGRGGAIVALVRFNIFTDSLLVTQRSGYAGSQPHFRLQAKPSPRRRTARPRPMSSLLSLLLRGRLIQPVSPPPSYRASAGCS